MNRFVLLILIVAPVSVFANTEPQMVIESRQAIKQFGSRLKDELQKGMKKGGPEKAIQVCHTVAKELADSTSQQLGWNIGRTSLKVRNPENAPDSWELQVLDEFEKRKDQGGDITKMEHYETIQTNEKKVFRYMKAIPTSGLCLSCHGQSLSTKVIEQLDTLYPEDQARGFETGDIRGAFTITRPVD